MRIADCGFRNLIGKRRIDKITGLTGFEEKEKRRLDRITPSSTAYSAGP